MTPPDPKAVAFGRVIWDVRREEYPSTYTMEFDDLPVDNRRVWNRCADAVIAAHVAKDAAEKERHAITEAGIAAGCDIRHGEGVGGLTVLGLVRELIEKRDAAEARLAAVYEECAKVAEDWKIKSWQDDYRDGIASAIRRLAARPDSATE